MSNDTHILNYLNQNPFRHIVLLKMRQAYPHAITQHWLDDAKGQGVLMLLESRASSYDAKTYPHTRYVVLMSSSNDWAAQTLVGLVPRHESLVFKLNSERDYAAVAAHFSLKRTTSVTSFTQIGPAPTHPIKHADSLRLSQTLDEACLPLFAQQGYDADEMRGYFSQGNASCIGLYQTGQAVAACFTYQNYRQIWEIGGVYTLPNARKHGYGRSVVAAALNFLCQNNLMPRYQVHEGNIASAQLALSLQLKTGLITTHYLKEN